MCNAFEKLNDVSGGNPAPTNDVMSLQTIKKIDEIRQELANIDIRLGDAVNLINGYISYKSEMISQQGIAAQVDSQRHENGASAPDYDSMTE